MASLFQSTDLEVRFSLNMNVLDADNVPRVMTLRQVLRAFLDHRHVVLQRRSHHRLGKIEHRLEVIMELSARVFVLNFGKLLATGTPAEIVSNHAVTKAYLGDEEQEAAHAAN